MIDINTLSGLRALVVGLGREGRALAKYLAEHGLTVTGTDLQPKSKFEDVLAPLETVGVLLVLGEHPSFLLDEVDILFVSPGIPLEVPFLREAQARKIPLSSETRLFCALCPAQIVGVTGSNGKTTTTSLVAKIMEAAGRKTWLGGNIGRPLIEVVDQIAPDDIVVVELSSFQLEYFHARLNEEVVVENISGATPDVLKELLDNWSPKISAILNITPNHLDRHPTMKHYVRAKRGIINYQGREGFIIMNLDNDMTRTIGNQFGGKTRWFSLEAQMPFGAALIDDELAMFDQDDQPETVVKTSEIKLRGSHNLSNVLAACLLSREAGASIEQMREAIVSFTGVKHRIEFVREIGDVNYYNDSIATSPERLGAALRSFDEPLILLAGGRDKHLPWDDVARLMMHKTKHVLLFGEADLLITQAIEKARQEITFVDTEIHHCETLDNAVNVAHQLAEAGDAVLLSPGCASFDAFQDFAERGERFVALVEGL